MKLIPPLFRERNYVYKFDTGFTYGNRRVVMELRKRTKDNRMRVKSAGNMAFTPKELSYAIELLS